MNIAQLDDIERDVDRAALLGNGNIIGFDSRAVWLLTHLDSPGLPDSAALAVALEAGPPR